MTPALRKQIAPYLRVGNKAATHPVQHARSVNPQESLEDSTMLPRRHLLTSTMKRAVGAAGGVEELSNLCRPKLGPPRPSLLSKSALLGPHPSPAPDLGLFHKWWSARGFADPGLRGVSLLVNSEVSGKWISTKKHHSSRRPRGYSTGYPSCGPHRRAVGRVGVAAAAWKETWSAAEVDQAPVDRRHPVAGSDRRAMA